MRIVACGNFIESRAGEELFAAGADASALRLTLKVAAEERWRILTVDIKVAFLNAPLVTTTRDQGKVQEDVVFALKPPVLLVKLGYAQSSEAWIAEKAMYGLRQSPRSWSIYRDRVMMDLEIEKINITQATSEPNLWVLKSTEDETLQGLILVYVDDMLITGRDEVVTRTLEQIQRVWQTSTPEEVADGASTKFLGMEIVKKGEVIRALQTSYVEDRLETNLGGDWKKAKETWMPCPKEIDDAVEDDVQPSHVKEAQRVVGELLWLVTRTRPDMAYTTSRMAQMVLRCPRAVVKMADQIWRYLKTTRNEGLSFHPDRGDGWGGESQSGLEAFSDASFAPGGGTSVGAVIIRWNGALMQWRAGRQPFPTLSAAEAELTESTEALVMGDSFDALVSDLYYGFPKVAFVDNMAAINLLQEESGVWRTRHLRLRAHHMRWRIHRTDWRIAHCPGSVMIADIGTKILSAARMRELKQLMGMIPEDEVENDVGDSGGALQVANGIAEQALRMILLAALVKSGTAQPGSEEEDEEMPLDRGGQAIEDANVFRLVVLMYTVAIVLATVIVQRFFRRFVQWNQASVAASMDPEERRRFMEEERQRAYAAIQSRLRRADRERREAEDQLMELEMSESMSSRRRRGGRLRRMVSAASGDRSRTPSVRSAARSSRVGRTSEEEYRTEPYGTPSRDDDEESQLGGSAVEEHHDENASMGLWADEDSGHRDEGEEATRRDVRDDVDDGGVQEGGRRRIRGTREESPVRHEHSREARPSRSSALSEETELRRLEHGVERLQRRLDAPEEEVGTPSLFSPSPSPVQDEEEDRESRESEATPEDIAGPAHWIEEIQGLVEPAPGEDGEEETPLDESPEPDPEGGDPDGDDHQGDDPEGDDPGGGGDGPGPNLPVRYTPEYTVRRTMNGTRYHTDDRCCTLHNTRRMERSHWCPTCAWITDAQRYGSVYLTPTGAVAHLDLHCPVLNGPPWIHYPHCQRCTTFPTRRLQWEG